MPLTNNQWKGPLFQSHAGLRVAVHCRIPACLVGHNRLFKNILSLLLKGKKAIIQKYAYSRNGYECLTVFQMSLTL